MKKSVIFGAVFCIIMAWSSAGYALDMSGKLGVGVDGGLLIPASGDMTSDSSFGDYFGSGIDFGAHVIYGIIPELSLQAGFRYSFFKMDDEADGDPDNEPYLNTPQVYLDAILNLGTFFDNPDNAINPYLKAGAGIYFWKMTEDGIGGDAIDLGNGDDFSKTSLGLNFGLGVEYFATSEISIFAEGLFDYIFTEDEDKFGSTFSNLGDIGIRVGFSYYFPLNSGE